MSFTLLGSRFSVRVQVRFLVQVLVLGSGFVVFAEAIAHAQQPAAPPGRGQGAGRGAAQAPAAAATGRSQAPYDLSGTWVALVTDDWRYRMLTPPKGNADFMPVNAEARRVMDAWDPAKDEASGEACRAYGAAGIMRLPGRSSGKVRIPPAS